MKVKELINELMTLHEQYGDVEVCGLTYDDDNLAQRVFIDTDKSTVQIEYDRPRELSEVVATHQPIVRIGEPKRAMFIQLNFTV